jgi:hypothetical protein
MPNIYNCIKSICEQADSNLSSLCNQEINEIHSFVDDKNFSEAVKLMLGYFEEEVIDVRIVYLYFIVKVMESDSAEYAGYIDELTKILNEFLEVLQPKKNFRLHLEKSAISFVEKLRKNIEYRIENQQIEKFELTELDSALGEFHDTVFKLAEYDINVFGIIELLTPFDKKQEKTVIEEKKEEGTEEVLSKNVQTKCENSNAAVNGNYLWDNLKDKITMFGIMITENRIVDAAILYEDINNELKDFDPRKYFPETFLPMYKAMNGEISNILSALQNKDTYEWFMASNFHHLGSGSDFLEYREKIDYPRPPSNPANQQFSDMGETNNMNMPPQYGSTSEQDNNNMPQPYPNMS